MIKKSENDPSVNVFDSIRIMLTALPAVEKVIRITRRKKLSEYLDLK